MNTRNPDLMQRVRTAGVLVAALLAIGCASLYWCFFHWLLFDLALVAVLLSGWEYASFSLADGTTLQRMGRAALISLPALFVAAGVSVLGICDRVGGYSPLIELAVLGFIFSFVGLAVSQLRSASLSVDEIGRELGEQLIALVFIGFCATWIMVLAAEQRAFVGLSWMIAVVALNDSIAYFAGRRYGSRPIAAVVSPKKTIEGCLAGLAGGVLAGGLLGLMLRPESSFRYNLLLAGLVVVAAQAGDLTKSLLKRIHNTKDSGTLLPGHGGVLDRIDGLIGAAPLFYLLRDWFGG